MKIAVYWIIGILFAVILGFLAFGRLEPFASLAVPSRPVPTAKKLSGEIKIGAVLPLSGDAAAYGLPIRKAIQLAAEEMNASNGVGGMRLTVVFADGKCETEAAAAAAEKLIRSERIGLIIGGACSGETLGMAPVANETKTIVISPSATSPEISAKGGPFVFRFAPSDALAAKAAAEYVFAELRVKRAAVVSELTDYAQGLRASFDHEFKRLGGVVSVDERYQSGTTDFRSQALKIRDAVVDAVYVLPQSPSSGVAIVRALKAQGVKARILTAEVLIGRDVAKENKALLQGVVGFEALFDETAAPAAAFLRSYEIRYKEKPAFPFFMANAYSETYLMKELMEKYDGDTKRMHEALFSLRDWNGGALENITLDPYGDVEWSSYVVKEIADGEVKDVKVLKF